MRLAALTALGWLLLGCSSPMVIVIPSLRSGVAREASGASRPEDCRYSRIVITHSVEAEGMSKGDAALTARVAELMRQEFLELGAIVTRDASEAYWSLMVMAARDERHYEGFVFSASVALRQLHEGRDPGVTVYSSRPAPAPGLATTYSGLGYGPGAELEQTVRAFIRHADAALVPAVRNLCAYQARNDAREADLERLIPTPVPL
jgi:hypothetical protein